MGQWFTTPLLIIVVHNCQQKHTDILIQGSLPQKNKICNTVDAYMATAQILNKLLYRSSSSYLLLFSKIYWLQWALCFHWIYKFSPIKALWRLWTPSDPSPGNWLPVVNRITLVYLLHTSPSKEDCCSPTKENGSELSCKFSTRPSIQTSLPLNLAWHCFWMELHLNLAYLV